MGKCKHCGKRGFLLPRDSHGFCEECTEALSDSARSLGRKIDRVISKGENSPTAVRLSMRKEIEEALRLVQSIRDIKDIWEGCEEKTTKRERRLRDLLQLSEYDRFNLPTRTRWHFVDYYATAVSIAVPTDVPVDFSELILYTRVSFNLEPENPFDDRAVAVYCGGQKIGYLFKGKMREWVYDQIEAENPVMGTLVSFDAEARKISVDIAFYKSKAESRYLFAKLRTVPSDVPPRLYVWQDVEVFEPWESGEFYATVDEWKIIGAFPSELSSLLEANPRREAFIVSVDEDGRNICVAVEK